MDSRGEGLRVFIWGRSIGRSGKVHQGDRCQFRENLGEIYSTFLVCEIVLVGTRQCRVPTGY